MGSRLVKAFDIAKENGGTQAQFRLAIRAAMSMMKAESAPDDEMSVLKMKTALKEILGKEVQI